MNERTIMELESRLKKAKLDQDAVKKAISETWLPLRARQAIWKIMSNNVDDCAALLEMEQYPTKLTKPIENMTDEELIAHDKQSSILQATRKSQVASNKDVPTSLSSSNYKDLEKFKILALELAQVPAETPLSDQLKQLMLILETDSKQNNNEIS